jgi:hypothetical protein
MTAHVVRSISIGLAGLMLGYLAGPVMGGEPEEVFDDLYGAELLDVRKTDTDADDVALGWVMLRDAELSTGSPVMMTLQCNGAFDLAGRSDPDEELMVTAMTLLATHNPSESEAAWARLAEHWERQYRGARGEARDHVARQWLGVLRTQAEAAVAEGEWGAAEAYLEVAMTLAQEADASLVPQLRVALTRAETRAQALATITEYLERLEEGLDDADLREEIILLYLLAMDDPASAMTHMGGSSDLFMQTYIPLANKPPEDISAQVASELLTWYSQLTAEAAQMDAHAMLERRANYLQRVLTDENLSADDREAMDVALLEARNTLALAGLDALETGVWTDVVESVDLDADRLEGTWTWDEQEDYLLSGTGGRSRMTLPVVMTGSYTVKIRVSRMSGRGAMMMVLPVGSSEVVLQVDEKGFSGLASIDGVGADANDSTTTDFELESDDEVYVETSVQIEGEQVEIRVRVDGRSQVKWEGKVSQLTASPMWSSGQAGRIVLGSNGSQFAFESLQVKPMDDGSKRVR